MHFYAFYASTRPLPDRFVIYKVKRTREKKSRPADQGRALYQYSDIKAEKSNLFG